MRFRVVLFEHGEPRYSDAVYERLVQALQRRRDRHLQTHVRLLPERVRGRGAGALVRAGGALFLPDGFFLLAARKLHLGREPEPPDAVPVAPPAELDGRAAQGADNERRPEAHQPRLPLVLLRVLAGRLELQRGARRVLPRERPLGELKPPAVDPEPRRGSQGQSWRRNLQERLRPADKHSKRLLHMPTHHTRNHHKPHHRLKPKLLRKNCTRSKRRKHNN